MKPFEGVRARDVFGGSSCELSCRIGCIRSPIRDQSGMVQYGVTTCRIRQTLDGVATIMSGKEVQR